MPASLSAFPHSPSQTTPENTTQNTLTHKDLIEPSRRATDLIPDLLIDFCRPNKLCAMAAWQPNHQNPPS